MAKRFQFDDEEIIDEEQSSYVNELEKKIDIPTYDIPKENIEDEEDLKVAKKKKKFVWKWWHFVLIGLGALAIAFAVYVFVASSNDGPVYGGRCEGLVTSIPENQINKTIEDIKKEYKDVVEMKMEVECKQLKVDITFKDGMKTKDAQKIAEKSVQMLDASIGMTKDKGKTYSHLFGYENNTPQFEVNLILISNNSKDFPIFGTKHPLNDSFGYTLASVKDEESRKSALDTLKEE